MPKHHQASILKYDLKFYMQIQVCLQRHEEQNISCITPSSIFVTQSEKNKRQALALIKIYYVSKFGLRCKPVN